MSNDVFTTIEGFGSTSLTEVDTHFYLYGSGGTGPSLKYQGADYVAGQFGQVTPIGAEQTASGYEVAWMVPGADQYSVWVTDNNGNYVSNTLARVSGASAALQSIETSFQQDLNGDGSIGPASPPAQTVIEGFGSTSLTEVGTHFYLYGSGGTGPSLKYQGADYVAGQFGQVTPIGAEQTASGYEVAWMVPGADQYSVWVTDNNGNYLSNTLTSVSGTSAALQSIETSFQQDLNGDGSIGAPPAQTVIEGFGSTSLTEVGTHFYLYGSGGTGPSLKYQGADYVAGQWGQVAPIGAEQTASGYEVAWNVPGADQYSVWVTDNNGNYLSNTLTSVSGTSAALQSIETSFHQDLNGDGSIGPASPPAQTVIEGFGSTSLTEVGTHFYLYGSGGTGPSLKYQGADYVAGQWGQVAPIGAEQTASGYEVAWMVPGADQYSVWVTDNNGNYLSNTLTSVSGTSAALQSIETSFHQDLNGDGSVGPASPPAQTVIEGFGSTSLTEVGTHFYLYGSGGTGPSLKYQGADYVAGQWGQVAPIGAEQTASGYEVAWNVPGADQYSVWVTDNNGNYLSNTLTSVSGTSAALQSIETSFHQDLNGDGSIGPASPPAQTVIEGFGSTSLTEVGTHFYLYGSGGTGPSLKYQGADYVAGQWGQVAPIGAEQTASGYEVAWMVPGADQYSVWVTDNNGNYLSNTLTSVSGTSAALQSIETSFQQDLNGDGSIGLANEVSSPHFVYQGVDGNGAQLFNVTWDTPGSHPFAVRVLAPDHPSTDYEHSFLYALPVQGGLAQSMWGSGLDELQKLDVQDQYNATIIEPIFPTDPWYADNANDATMNYETFMAKLLPAWVDSNLATSGTEENLLIGFSKSGYGGVDLLFKNPSLFDAVAAWDFPADMVAYNLYGAGENYGTDTNFQNNYRLTDTFIDTWKAPFTTEDRIWISEGPAFQTDVADFDALLTSQGVLHTLLTQTNDSHSWFGGWLSDAVAGLYNLVETNWVTGVSGDWSTASDWLSGAVPTPIVDAVINNSNSVTVDGAGAAHALTLDNSDLTVSGTLTLGTSLTLDELSELNLSGGVLSAQSIEVGASGHFLGGGAILGPVEVTGTIEVSQSALELTGGVSGTGLFTIDNGATLQFDGSVASGTTASFLGASGTLIIEQPSSFDGHISGISGSGDVLDLVGFDPAHTTAEPTFNSGSDTTTLTVTDSTHALSVSLTLDGDYSNSTFAVTSDGHGGADVVDPPAIGSAGIGSSDSSDGASGTITFANFNFTNTETANFGPEGSDYVGMFSLDPVSSSNGSASVGWEFHLGNDQIKPSPGETVTQSYDVTVNDEQSSTVNQTVSVSVGGPGNDNFVFHPGMGADTIVNFNPQIDTIELDHFANIQSTQQLAALVTADPHGNAVIDLGHNDSITLPNVNSTQLQAALQSAVHLL